MLMQFLRAIKMLICTNISSQKLCPQLLQIIHSGVEAERSAMTDSVLEKYNKNCAKQH